MGGCHGYPPLSAFCPHLLIACFAVIRHLPSILNIGYQQVKRQYVLRIIINYYQCLDLTHARARAGIFF